jgi:hypothetical protein
MLPTGKKIRVPLAGYFVYGWLIIASLLPRLGYTGRLFISCGCSCNFFIGCLDVVLCSKTLC